MTARYILAIDQGTTSSRAILFDHSGGIHASAQQEFRQHYPQPGWVEHDPEEIWASQCSVIEQVLVESGTGKDEIAGIGITNQRETTVVWDRKSGEPIHPAIVWQDRRTADICNELKRERLEPIFREKSGLLLDPYFSGTKLSWILTHVEGAAERAASGDLLFGTIDSWLVWKLTGGQVHVTDVTNASRTLLMNIHTGDWDEELLQILGVPPEVLPPICSCSEILGMVESVPGIEGLPIAGIAGDQQAALFGQACFDPGMAKNTYGTGCFLLMNTGNEAIPSKNNLLTTIAWGLEGKLTYALEGSVFIGGAVVQWLRDELGIIQTAQECDQLAETVEDSSGLFIVPAFTGLGAPHWDPYARGVAVGITRGTNKAHFCRAALESIAYQSSDLITCMEKDSGLHLKELRVDGGASRSHPLLQFQADLLQSNVVRPDCIETTALGAAYLAGLAVGFWKSREDIRRNWQEAARFQPGIRLSEAAESQSQWARAVECSKGWEPR
ncbi:MAG: glycerol kinase GlpK [Puniceicoccaceae bacterium]